MAALLEKAGRKVRAPESSVAVNNRSPKGADQSHRDEYIRENSCMDVKRGNLYAEQGQTDPDSGSARSYS